ncbi:MAG: cation-translocating P-type ATPase [Coriobacteriales bacterium]|jgi:heavy metal translocating P-type ATPase|nr:cation-translocating P-type ATPase [Coriobacteriales bacterium]
MITFFRDDEKRTLLILALSAVALVVSFFNIGNLPIDAAWVAIVLCGLPIFKGAVVGLVTKFDIKADVLVSLALIASVIIGETFAAGEIAFIMTIGSYLEERTVAKARHGIERLVRLAPVTARVVRGTIEEVVPASEVAVNDLLRVLAGEAVPVDGVIVSGHTSIDQSVMTGEPLPVDKAPGDKVLSGTVNQFGTFDMRAEKVGEESSLQRMVRLVESADAGKAKIVGLADRWATWIVVIALAAALGTWLVTQEATRSVTILVVFCPCALVLATPTAIMAGIGNATRRGVLVSQGDALERMAKVRRIAFDKTGTLTYGKPLVSEVCSCDPEVGEKEMLLTAASAELRSEHPLGKAIVDHARQQALAPFVLHEPKSFMLQPGRGVAATVEGRHVLAGNREWLEASGVLLPPALVERAKAAEGRSCTVVYVASYKRALGLIAVSDAMRPDAADVVGRIHNSGVKTALLTGDAEAAAQRVAQVAGIADVHAACLPEHKLAQIRRYQAQGEPVCMVGDGINDAPALKAADVGVAMGGIGSDIAIESADIALVHDNIHEIPALFQLAKKVMQTINVNIIASLFLNFVAILLAMAGILSPVLGALVHNVGSVAVIINSSLLLKWRNKQER